MAAEAEAVSSSLRLLDHFRGHIHSMDGYFGRD
jgi:hypothetical protein